MTEINNLDGMRCRLEQALKSQGFSMRRAGLESGLSDTVVHGIIKLGRDPGTETLAKICNTVGVSMAWVLFGDEIDPESKEILDAIKSAPAKRAAILALLRE